MAVVAFASPTTGKGRVAKTGKNTKTQFKKPQEHQEDNKCHEKSDDHNL